MATVYLKVKQKLRSIRWMLFAVTLINMMSMFILKMIGSFFEGSVPTYIEALITGVFAYVVPISIFAKTEELTAEAAAERFCLKKCKPSYVALAAVGGLCFQFVVVIINLPFNLILNDATSYMPTTASELLAEIFVIGIMPAVFEEFLFRGIVMGSMSKLNKSAAIVFSTVMFAIMHGDMYSLAGYVVMGLALAVLVSRTESLYTAMAFHFTNNLAALLLGYFNSELIYAPTATIRIFVAGIVGFLLCFAVFFTFTKKKTTENKIKTSVLLAQSFTSVPILLCIAIVAAAGLLMSVL